MKPHVKMLIGIAAGLSCGLLARLLFPDHPVLAFTVDNLAMPIGKIFLRLLFMLVVPLLFSALVMGVCELDLRQLGRLGMKTLAYTVVVSTCAVLIGMVLVNTLRPGDSIADQVAHLKSSGSYVSAVPKPADKSAVDLIVEMVPDNPIKAAATGDMIGLIIFSLIFGIGLATTTGENAGKLKDTLAGLYDVMMRLIDAVLKLAPFGVGALLFSLGARLGFDLLKGLAAYVGVVLLGLALQMFVVYPITIYFLGRRNPIQFFKDVRLAMITAFSTASSSATLPTALKVAEEQLKLPKHVSRFVLTAGSAMNQNGTALFEGVTVLFLAQLSGVHLGLQQQAVVMFICVLGGIGTAGVPAGSLPVIAMILAMFGIPVEGLGLILGVDRFLDMCRTTLNVTGDLAAAVSLASGESGSLDGAPPARRVMEDHLPGGSP
jgi:DAACS family dicarboxylate/amino acid:cation (Na+ or H+) symporter